MNQTKVIAGSAYLGACDLTCDLVAALLGLDSYEPTGVAELLSLHEAATGTSHDFESLSTTPSVQQLLSSERHWASYSQLSKGECPLQKSYACFYHASCQ